MLSAPDWNMCWSHIWRPQQARASSRCLPTLLLSQHSHGWGKPDELALQEELGRGAFGCVYKATSRGSLCAAKTMNDSNEAKILQVLSAWPPLHSADARKSSHGQPGLSCHRNCFGRGSGGVYMSESWRGSFLCSLHSACASAFAQPLHRTLWPERVQLLVDERGYLKVIDFGMAAILDGPSLVPKRIDAHYLAPEVMQVNRQVPGAAGYWLTAGLWSLGVFLYNAFLGRLPFADEEDLLPTDIYNAILYDHSPPDCSEICEIDHSLAELVERLLCRWPDKRPRDFSGLTFFHGMQWKLLLSRQVVPPHLRWLPLKNFHTAPQLCKVWKCQSETKKVGHLGVENMACHLPPLQDGPKIPFIFVGWKNSTCRGENSRSETHWNKAIYRREITPFWTDRGPSCQ